MKLCTVVVHNLQMCMKVYRCCLKFQSLNIIVLQAGGITQTVLVNISNNPHHSDIITTDTKENIRGIYLKGSYASYSRKVLNCNQIAFFYCLNYTSEIALKAMISRILTKCVI